MDFCGLALRVMPSADTSPVTARGILRPSAGGHEPAARAATLRKRSSENLIELWPRRGQDRGRKKTLQ